MSDKPWVFEVRRWRLRVVERGTCSPLDGAIQKWSALVEYMESHGVDEFGPDDGSEDTCPLCAIYLDGATWECSGCPISLDGHWRCMGTPYRQYNGFGARLLCDAKAELEYLRDLKARLEEAEHDENG